MVIDSNQRTRVPFLRGILTRSLQDAGLPFDDAYRLASTIRQQLGHAATVTTAELRETVIDHLRRDYDVAFIDRYRALGLRSATLWVRDAKGRASPFSRSQHRRTLKPCGLSTAEATHLTGQLYEHLVKKGASEISTRYLGQLTYRYLKWTLGPESAHRYLVWIDFLHSERPLLVLIGGTAGSGKSTIATKLTTYIEKARLQSTDMLREVMRTLIPERLLPVLHTSSFNAWGALPEQCDCGNDSNASLVAGYCAQAELVSVACEAVVRRALKERVSLILEGVHVQPSLLAKIPEHSDAVVVPIMLAILKPAQLGNLIQVRGRRVPDRRSERYLAHFDEIWRLQTFLLSEADRAGIPIIANDDEEKAVQQILGIAIEALSKNFSATPKEVYL